MGRAEREGLWWYYLDDGVYGSIAAASTTTRPIPSKASRRKGVAPFSTGGTHLRQHDVIAENILLPRLKAGDLLVGRVMGPTPGVSQRVQLFPRPRWLQNETGDHGKVDE
jgi:ornithine decarboxylase